VVKKEIRKIGWVHETVHGSIDRTLDMYFGFHLERNTWLIFLS
jgi:hypothetical protein